MNNVINIETPSTHFIKNTPLTPLSVFIYWPRVVSNLALVAIRLYLYKSHQHIFNVLYMKRRNQPLTRVSIPQHEPSEAWRGTNSWHHNGSASLLLQ